MMPAAEVLIQTALLGEAVEAGPALVFVADEEMRYIAVNQFACQALGYTREEFLGLYVPEVAREPGASAEYDELLARGVRHGTAALTRKDGSTVDFFYRAAKTKVAGLSFFVSVGFLGD
jgi:PAS domain S-box-containing protein